MPISERPEFTDRPQPEDTLTGAAARTDDHQPTDADDRVVEPVEPDEPTPPIDEEDLGTPPEPTAA